MRAFSQLLDDLVYTRSRNTKLKLIGDYLRETPDPDRGFGLAALTGTLEIPAVKGAAVRAIAEERLAGIATGIFYAPIDYPFAVRRVLRRIKPAVSWPAARRWLTSPRMSSPRERAAILMVERSSASLATRSARSTLNQFRATTNCAIRMPRDT